MRYDRGSTDSAGIQACLAGMRLKSVLVSIARCNIGVIVALIISLVVEFPNWQLAVNWGRGCWWWRRG